MKSIFSLIVILMNLAAPAADMGVNNISLDTSVEEISKGSIIYDYEISTFSYEEDLGIYKENDPGVKYDGFNNTSEIEINNSEEAIERAKNECTVEYDTVKVYYDDLSGMWKVLFYNKEMLGGDQSVYLDNSGVTCLIVYGE